MACTANYKTNPQTNPPKGEPYSHVNFTLQCPQFGAPALNRLDSYFSFLSFTKVKTGVSS